MASHVARELGAWFGSVQLSLAISTTGLAAAVVTTLALGPATAMGTVLAAACLPAVGVVGAGGSCRRRVAAGSAG